MALEGLRNFEHILKMVIIQNFSISWQYSCQNSGNRYTISHKTKLARCLALFQGKGQFTIETTDSINVETLVTVEGFSKMNPTILYLGLPLVDEDIVASL